jgi:hypothetical protein
MARAGQARPGVVGRREGNEGGEPGRPQGIFHGGIFYHDAWEATSSLPTWATQASPPFLPATPAPTRRVRFPPRFKQTYKCKP